MTPSSTIAHYRITSKLGQGGMGAVFRATDTKLSRDVAIKILPDTFAADPDRLARFTREAQVLASLNHPNIAAIYGVEDRAIVMELVEGQTLAGPLPPGDALPLIHQLIDALEYAHEKNVIHRDLKPANIKITPEGRLKVLDFGLAKALSSETPAADPTSSPTLTMRATMAGMIMGTAAYMAPEQARGHYVDKRADIWSFGVVVYEILTGKTLFDAPTVTDTLAAVLRHEPDFTLVPAHFHRLLRLCLTRDPHKRLRDIGDARPLLEEPTPASAPPARSRYPWIAAAVFALSACGFAGLWLRSSTPYPAPYRFTLDILGPILFSPNGRWMVNLSNGLRVRSVGSVGWQLLPGTEAASDPFWSPDSSTIGFFANGRLRAISIDGANPRSIAAAPDPRGGSWRGGVSDGVILFSSAAKLQTVDLGSGKVHQLPLRFSDSQAPSLPVFCPEGDGFVYLVVTASRGVGSLFRSTLSSPRTTGERVLDTPYGVSIARSPRTGRWQLFFVRRDAAPGIANRLLLTAPIDPRTGALAGEPVRLVDAMSNWVGTGYASFDVSAGGIIYWRNTTPSLPIWRLRWFDRNGNVTGTIGDAAGYASISLSPDDSRLAALQGYPEQHIWIYNVQNGTGARLSSLTGSEGNPVWSPDGRSIYYINQTEAGSRVIRQSADPGSVPEILYESSDGLSVQDVAPDGRYLLLVQYVQAGGIVRLDLKAPREARKLETVFPAAGRFTAQTNVRISPDGHTLLVTVGGLAYSCRYPDVGDSVLQIAAFPFPAWPFFSRDGRLLYFVSGQSLYSHPVTAIPGGGIRLGERSLLFRVIHPARADANLGAASHDGNRLLTISADDAEEARIQVLSDWTVLLPRAPR